jgi:hypothetical protein
MAEPNAFQRRRRAKREQALARCAAVLAASATRRARADRHEARCERPRGQRDA